MGLFGGGNSKSRSSSVVNTTLNDERIAATGSARVMSGNASARDYTDSLVLDGGNLSIESLDSDIIEDALRTVSTTHRDSVDVIDRTNARAIDLLGTTNAKALDVVSASQVRGNQLLVDVQDALATRRGETGGNTMLVVVAGVAAIALFRR